MGRSLRVALKRSAWMLTLALSVAAGWGTLGFVEERGHHELSLASERKVDLYYSGLESELGRYEYLPQVLQADPDIRKVLKQPDPALVEAVNRKLQDINGHAQSTSISILTTQGLVVSSSNWQPPDGVVGAYLGFRASFHDALHKGQGRLFAFHGVRGEPGYYYAHELLEDGRTIGISLIEANLERIERNWWPGSERALVLDEQGVVILSSTSQWKFRSARAPDDEQLSRARASQLYGTHEIAPLDLVELESLDDGAKLMRVSTPTGSGVQPQVYVVRSLTMPRTGWSVVLLADTQELRLNARIAGTMAGLAVALLGVMLMYMASRRQVARQRLAMSAALKQANDELERRVLERTGELQASNNALVQEVAERKRAEASLRHAQDELVQASKLAALGRMAAGVAHEVNQPLQALQVLCSNALKHLEASRPDDVRRNVLAVVALGDRMRGISRQLKSFARKDGPQASPVAVRPCVDAALAILAGRLQERAVAVDVDVPAQTQVMGEASQLEQVFINLLSNAIDALAGTKKGRVTVSAHPAGDRVLVRVADNGPGIAPEALPHMFEPFFTTKPSGEGLGLGLAICDSIVRNLGGQLSAGNAVDGGAVFEFAIRALADADRMAAPVA